MTEWVLTCPECGATEDEVIESMFSGPEPAIRRQGKQAECKKCGFKGLIPTSSLKEAE